MNLLFLGPENSVYEYLNNNHMVKRTEDKLNVKTIGTNYDLVISYGYRHIIKKPVIDMYRGKIINLHISFLPYNRGADPNLWSILNNTPKGVTIHHLDEGLDTGRIIIQKEIVLSKDDTLKTSYNKLSTEMLLLFKTLNLGQIPLGVEQEENKATLNKLKDKDFFFKYFTDGWDTNIEEAKKIYNKVIGGC